jgi:hypothetical protein
MSKVFQGRRSAKVHFDSKGGEVKTRIKETSDTRLYAANGHPYVDSGTKTPHDYYDVNDANERAVNLLLAGKAYPLKIVHEILIERIE